MEFGLAGKTYYQPGFSYDDASYSDPNYAYRSPDYIDRYRSSPDLLDEMADYVVDGLINVANNFADGLVTVSNKIYYAAATLFRFDTHLKDLENLNTQFVNALDSVSSIPNIDKEESRPAIYDRSTLVKALEKLEKDAIQLGKHHIVRLEIAKVIKVLNANDSKLLNIEEWAYVSKKFDQISEEWEGELNHLNNEQGQTNTAYENFIKRSNEQPFANDNLAKICKNKLIPNLKKIHLETRDRAIQLQKEEDEARQNNGVDKKADSIKRNKDILLALNSRAATIISVFNQTENKDNKLNPVAGWDTIVPLLKKIEREVYQVNSTTQLSFFLATEAIEKTGIFDVRQKALTASQKALHQQRAAQILNDLKLVSRVQAAYLSEDEAKVPLAQHYKKQTQMGNLASTSHSASVGVSTPFSAIGPSISGGVTGIHEVTEYTDDEGYAAKTIKKFAGVFADFKLAFGLGKIVANGSTTPFTGDYWECLNEQTCATTQFTSAILESRHRDNPDIARYLSRSSILATSKTVGKFIPPALKEEMKRVGEANVIGDILIGDKDEVAEFDELKLAYDSVKESMEKRLTLYMTSSDQAPEQMPEIDEEPKSSAEPKRAYAHTPLTPVSREFGIIPGDLSGSISRGNFTAELGLQDGLGNVKLGGKEDGDLFKVALIGEVERECQTIRVTKKTGMEEHYANPLRETRKLSKEFNLFDPDSWSTLLSDSSENIIKEKDLIKQQITERFNVFKEKLIASWTMAPMLTTLGLNVFNRANNPKITDEEFLTFLNEKGLNNHQNLVNLRAIKGKDDEETKSLRRQQILAIDEKEGLSKKPKSESATFDEGNLADLMRCFTNLKNDFEVYTNLQARITEQALKGLEVPQDAATAEILAERYGASTPEQLLQRMVYANAYLLTQAKDVKEASELKDQLIENTKAFGKSLIDPKFAVDKAKVKALCCIHEIIDFTATRYKMKLEVKFPSTAPLVPAPKFKIKITQRRQEHTNILRAGDYWDIEFSAGGDFYAKPVLTAIAPYIYEYFTDQEFTKEVLDTLGYSLDQISPNGMFGAEATYRLRFARPDKLSSDSKDFSFSHYFDRLTIDQIARFSLPSIPIPLGIVDLIYNYEYTKASFDLKKERTGRNTAFYPAIFYVHEINTGTVNKVTGKIKEGSNWLKFRNENKEQFEQIFLNYANNYRRWPDLLYDGDEGDIGTELNEMEKAINNNVPDYLLQALMNYQAEYNVTKDKSLEDRIKLLKEAVQNNTKPCNLPPELNALNFSYAKKEFKDAVVAYRDNATEENYSKALICFDGIMLAFAPHWMERRANSKNVKLCNLPQIEDNSAVIAQRVKERKLQDQQRQFLKAA